MQAQDIPSKATNIYTLETGHFKQRGLHVCASKALPLRLIYSVVEMVLQFWGSDYAPLLLNYSAEYQS